MVSEYGYLTTTLLEVGNYDYSTQHSDFTDAFLEGKISESEIDINEETGQTFSGTIPVGIIKATKILTEKRMRNAMIERGLLEPTLRETKFLDDPLVVSKLTPYKRLYRDVPGVFVYKG